MCSWSRRGGDPRRTFVGFCSKNSIVRRRKTAKKIGTGGQPGAQKGAKKPKTQAIQSAKAGSTPFALHLLF